MNTQTESGANQVRTINLTEDSSAADVIRSMRNWCNNTTEGVLDDYSLTELIKLYAAFKACDWDLTIDQWTARQRWEALNENKIPQWGEHDRDPVYTDPKRFELAGF